MLTRSLRSALLGADSCTEVVGNCSQSSSFVHGSVVDGAAKIDKVNLMVLDCHVTLIISSTLDKMTTLQMTCQHIRDWTSRFSQTAQANRALKQPRQAQHESHNPALWTNRFVCTSTKYKYVFFDLMVLKLSSPRFTQHPDSVIAT